MARFTRNYDWGFPRWRAYGQERQAERVRLCDHEGCDKPGDCPAPKSPYSNEKWWFCAEHAADYNKNWNYFAGLSDEEAQARAREEETRARGYRQSAHWGWSGEESGTAAERQAFAVLGLEATATAAEIKTAYRKLAKTHHPDANPDDAQAAERFHAVQKAYDLLSRRPAK